MPPYRRYNPAQQAMHWAVVLLCASQVPTSWAIQRTHMAHAFMQPDPFDLFLHKVHAWSGWLILGLVVLRVAARILRKPPSVSATPLRSHRAAQASHAALYALLIALPVTGTLSMYISRSFAPVHSALTWVLLALVVIHVSAALWHHFVVRDNVLKGMLR